MFLGFPFKHVDFPATGVGYGAVDKTSNGFFNGRSCLNKLLFCLRGQFGGRDVSKVLLSRQHLQTNSMVLRQQMGKHDD